MYKFDLNLTRRRDAKALTKWKPLMSSLEGQETSNLQFIMSPPSFEGYILFLPCRSIHHLQMFVLSTFPTFQKGIPKTLFADYHMENGIAIQHFLFD